MAVEQTDSEILGTAAVLQSSLLKHLSTLPHDGSADAVQRATLIRDTNPLFSNLRALSRGASEDARRGKQLVTEARSQLDSASLKIQNLAYQRRHLEDEIRSCRDFRSIYDTIPLTDMEDFRVRAPERDTTQEILSDPHALQLARLRFELAERQRLETEKQSLQAERGALLKENKEKKERLEGLEVDLKEMLSRSAQVRKRFEEAEKESTSRADSAMNVDAPPPEGQRQESLS